eukprot:470172_1
MFIIEIIIIAAVSSIALGSHSQQVARFEGTNGVTGTVTVDYGSIKIDLDLSDWPELPNGFKKCTEKGLQYHIHEVWTHKDIKEGIISDCGASFTGGHYDPWTACEARSGNKYCVGQGGCIDDVDYLCDIDRDPYSCEVG